MMLDHSPQRKYTRHELINWLLFNELHGRHIVLELFEEHDGVLVSSRLVLKPFTFKWDGTIHEHVFSEGDYSGVIRFDPRNPMVYVNYINPKTHVYTSWSYRIKAFLPELADNGVIHLNLLRYSCFSIDKITVFYDHIDEVKPEWMDALRMELHPLTQLESPYDVTTLLHELDVTECFMLTQLGYIVEFELTTRRFSDE